MKVQRSFQDDAHGALYLVGTPIGNLEDITYRAVRILKEADWIAAEDTRQTQKLLNHLGISAKMISYHEHNQKKSGKEIVALLKAGQTVALVSDAGLPGISDPGEDLVKNALEEGIPVIPVPGPNAALSALIASGLPSSPFLFLGFPPRSRKELRELLERYLTMPNTTVFYEAPHRLEKTLAEFRNVWGNRPVVLAREITKRYEEFFRGTVDEALDWLGKNPPRGEYCVIVAGSQNPVQKQENSLWWDGLSVEQHLEAYIRQGLDRKEAIKQIARDRGVPKREIYNFLLR